MSVTFSHTLRALDVDRSRRRVGVPLLGLAVAAWTAWFLLGRVAVYEVTDLARLEVQSSAHPLAAPVDGRVLGSRLQIGREVRQGDVLVELEAEAERLAIAEQRARLAALTARREALSKEIGAEQDALAAREKGRAEARAEARALALEAQARMRAAEIQARISARLKARDAVSRETLLKDEAEAEARRAQAQALAQATARGEQDRLVQESDRKTQLARLEHDQAELGGDMAIAQATIRKLEYELELRTIRAPVSGRIGESAEVRPGTVVRAGQRLGTVVPPGHPRVVAHFPVAAIERIRAGQSARVRLEGFPWTQYGAVPASVADTGSEPGEGRIRVELALDPDRPTAIPLTHGLPGTVEVEVERISPAVLVLRAAGQYLTVGTAGPPRQDDRRQP